MVITMKNKTTLKGSCSSYTVMEVLKFLIPSYKYIIFSGDTVNFVPKLAL